jgi:hypothetical protein
MQSKAQLVRYLFLGTPGVLALQDGRLTFTTDGHQRLLDTPVQEISHVRPSWVGYGSLLVIRVGGRKYAFRMADMVAAGPVPAHSNLVAQGVAQSAREISAIAKARQCVKEWCSALQAARA